MVPRQRIGVGVVALDEAERILLLRHVFHPHIHWGLPGGWLKRNESPVEGALREFREETGVMVELGPVVHISHQKQPPHITIVFSGQAAPGPFSLSPEIFEAAWFSTNSLPPLFPATNQAIAAALAWQSRRDAPTWGSSSRPIIHRQLPALEPLEPGGYEVDENG